MSDDVISQLKLEQQPKLLARWDKWRNVPVVCLWEAAALSLNIEPEQIRTGSGNFTVPANSPDFPFRRDRRNRAFKDKERLFTLTRNVYHNGPIVPFLPKGRKEFSEIRLQEFAVWAYGAGWDIPAELADLANEAEVSGHAGQLAFDPDDPNYPYELDIACLAWRAVTNSLQDGKTPKQQIKEWIEAHYPDVTSDARRRIATVCNWEKGGGRPSKGKKLTTN